MANFEPVLSWPTLHRPIGVGSDQTSLSFRRSEESLWTTFHLIRSFCYCLMLDGWRSIKAGCTIPSFFPARRAFRTRHSHPSSLPAVRSSALGSPTLSWPVRSCQIPSPSFFSSSRTLTRRTFRRINSLVGPSIMLQNATFPPSSFLQPIFDRSRARLGGLAACRPWRR